MATPPIAPDLAWVDAAIRSLITWLAEHQIPCTRAEIEAVDAATSERIAALDPLTRAQALAIFLTIGELESFAGRFDPSRGVLWELFGRVDPDRFYERLHHELVSQYVIEEVRGHRHQLETLVRETLRPLEEHRREKDLVPQAPPGVADQFEADAECVVKQTLTALYPMLLAAARQVPRAPGFRHLQVLATETDASLHPATTLARVAYQLLGIGIDTIAVLGDFSLHVSEIPPSKRGWSRLLIIATARLDAVGFTTEQIAKLLPDDRGTVGAVKRVQNRLRSARQRGLPKLG